MDGPLYGGFVMHKSPTIRIARRIFVRLARATPTVRGSVQSVYAMANAICQWPRELREAWVLERYDLIKSVAHIDEVSLARFVTGIDYH